ncbi:MAG: hypothetical protein ACYC4Q_01010 [Victivallaceae bacterium]
MNSRFLTAMTAAGIIALGTARACAENNNSASIDKTSVAPAGKSGEKELGKTVKPQKKRQEPLEGREPERERVIEFIIKEKYPQDFAEVVALRKDAPEKAKEKMQALRKKVWDEQIAEREKLRDMIAKYKESKDSGQLEAIKQKVTEKLNERLEMEKKIIAQGEEKIKEMQEKLDKFKAEHQKRVDNKDQMIENKIKDLSKSPEMFY